MTQIETLFIEFGGTQLTVTSDDPKAIEYFRRNYELMLVPGVTKSAGELSVMRSSRGYNVRATKDFEHPASLDLLFAFLRREVLLFFIRARPDLFWMHAGAVEKDGHAILVAGTSGRGKSSIVTRLCERGWKLLSDENAPIDMKTNEIHPFPQMPRRRLPIDRQVEVTEFDTIAFEEIRMSPEHVRYHPSPIRAMVFPRFEHGAHVSLERLNPGEAALEIVRNSTNFADHKAAGVEQAAEMARAIAGYRLTYGDTVSAASVVNDI